MAEQQAGQDEGAKDSAKAGLGDPERTARLCAAMKAAGLDAVVCTSPSEVLLLTGYWPIFATSVAVLTAEGAMHAIVPEDEQELAAGSSGAQLTTYEPEMLTKLTGPVAQLREPLGAVLTQLGLERATIGVRLQLGVQPVSYGVMTEFRQSLGDLLGKLAPEARLESCDDLLEAQKAVRTPRELERMRLGSKVAAVGFGAAEKAIQTGLREAEVAAAVQAAFDAAPEAEAPGRSYGFFFCMSGPNSATAAAAYARTRQRRIEKDDLVMIHANTCADGFWTDITRTYTAGGERVERHEDDADGNSGGAGVGFGGDPARGAGAGGRPGSAVGDAGAWVRRQAVQACDRARGGVCGGEWGCPAANSSGVAGRAGGGNDL